MKVSLRIIAVAAALVILVGSTAFAATSHRLTLKSPLPSVTGSIYVEQANRWESAYIGPVWIEVFDVAANQSLGLQKMLCVDLLGQITLNQTWNANLVTGKPSGVVTDTAWNRAVWMAQHTTGWNDGAWPAQNPPVSAAAQDAAIQLAVWEVIRDDSNFNLDSGGFRVGSTLNGANRSQVAQIAQGYFDSSTASHDYVSTQQWFDAVGTGQDMVFFIPQPPPSVPEIPAAMLAPMGLAAVGIIRRKLSV